MTSLKNDQVEAPSGDATAAAGTRGRTAAIGGAVAVLLCGASRADMERWVTVAQNTFPDAEEFANFLGHEASVIDQKCPSVRPTLDVATWAAASIRLAPSK